MLEYCLLLFLVGLQLIDWPRTLRKYGEMSLVTTKEAARALGITPVRVRQLIKEKRLAAEKHGRDHLLQDLEVERFRQCGRRSGPKGGRPPGNKA
jgi:excisionase family DNA binding protein